MEIILLSNARHLGFQNSESLNVSFCETKKFLDGELAIELSKTNFNASSFLVIQSFFGKSDSILELLFTLDVISRNTSKPTHLLIPYLAYSRQDRQITPTSPISAKVIANLIPKTVQTVSVINLHAPQIQGFFHQPCFDINFEDIFIEHITKRFNTSEIVIVSADIGGAKNARKIAQKIGVESAIVEKQRTQANVSQALYVVGEVKNKHCILIDDIIDTAGTLCNAAQILHENGAKSVTAYATHGIFSGTAFEKIENSYITNIFVSNTIPLIGKSSKIFEIDCTKHLTQKILHKLTAF